MLPVGFDTYSLAFQHFFSFQFSFYLVGTLHLGKEGSSTLLFMMFAKTKRQARSCLFTFYISLRLAKIGIVEGMREGASDTYCRIEKNKREAFLFTAYSIAQDTLHFQFS